MVSSECTCTKLTVFSGVIQCSDKTLPFFTAAENRGENRLTCGKHSSTGRNSQHKNSEVITVSLLSKQEWLVNLSFVAQTIDQTAHLYWTVIFFKFRGYSATFKPIFPSKPFCRFLKGQRPDRLNLAITLLCHTLAGSPRCQGHVWHHIEWSSIRLVFYNSGLLMTGSLQHTGTTTAIRMSFSNMKVSWI